MPSPLPGKMTMNYQKLFRSVLMSTTLVCALIYLCLTVAAQDQAQEEQADQEESAAAIIHRLNVPRG